MQHKVPGLSSSLSYSIYLCTGIFTWGLFNEIILRTQNIFVENANILKKISFPRHCLPVIVVLNAIVNFLIVFGLFTIFLILSNNLPGISYIAVVPLIIILIGLAYGIGFILGMLNVFFRDVNQFFAVIMQFWFWLTPIVYPISSLSPKAQSLMSLNPMTVIINGFQTSIVSKNWPDWYSLLYPACLALLFSILATRIFHTQATNIMDEL